MAVELVSNKGFPLHTGELLLKVSPGTAFTKAETVVVLGQPLFPVAKMLYVPDCDRLVGPMITVGLGELKPEGPVHEKKVPMPELAERVMVSFTHTVLPSAAIRGFGNTT